jgi:hypothetical protein
MKAKFQGDPLGGPLAPPALRPMTTADAGPATSSAAATATKAAAAAPRPAPPNTSKS